MAKPESPSPTPSVRRKKLDRLTAADMLRGLADRFSAASGALLAPGADRVVVAEVRECMANAGRVILTLLMHRVIEPPTRLPGWLRLSSRQLGRRPKFDGFLVDAQIGKVRTEEQVMSCMALIRYLIQFNPAIRRQPRHRRTDYNATRFRYRQVFLEAVTGWIGDRYQLRPRFATPTERVFLATKNTAQEEFVELCVDLVDLPVDEERMFFLSVAQGAVDACRHLAGDVADPFWEETAAQLPDSDMRKNVLDLVEEQKLTGRPSDEAILNGIRDWESLHAVREDLQALINLPESTPAELGAKWQKLTSWRSRLADFRDGHGALNFGKQVGWMRHYAKSNHEVPPAITWATAFRDVTLKLVPRCPPASESLFAVHRLVQLLDDLLAGSPADITEAVRGVDLTVRVMADRPAEDDSLRPPPKVPPIPEVNMLVRDGAVWHLRFGGVDCRLRDLVGLAYLQQLVARPGTPIHVANLQGGGLVQVEAKNPIADTETRLAVKRDFEDAKERLAEGEENGDLGAIDAAHKKLEELGQYVKEASSPVGPTQMPTEVNRVRSAVGNAIRKALRELQSAHDTAHAHLQDHLDGPTGFTPCYGKPGMPPWQVNLAPKGNDKDISQGV